jgi:hypothetical protein
MSSVVFGYPLRLLIFSSHKLRGISPPANYTDRTTAFCRRGCHVVSVTEPYGRILGFLEWSRYSSF